MIEGEASGDLDPLHPLNRDITNIALAPRNERGLVDYRFDFNLARPIDAARGNGWLFYDVPNRGGPAAPRYLNGHWDIGKFRSSADAGNGFLLREGYTLLWAGWQCDLPAGDGVLRAEFPIAMENGAPLTGRTSEEFIDEGGDKTFIASLGFSAATLDPNAASLTVRERERDARCVPPGLAWRYLDDRRIEITRPDDDAFDKGAIYEFIYTAKGAVIGGMAFAALRDFIAWMRFSREDESGNPNPLFANGVNTCRRALMFGSSQSGRFARDFLYQGFNQDLSGRQVFDAVVPMICGSRKTALQIPFSRPGRFQRQHEDHCFPGDQFPFTYAPVTDPLSGATDDILARCRASGSVPKIMHIESDSEYWTARASLLSTDCEGRDLALPENVRFYVGPGLRHASINVGDDNRAVNAVNEVCIGLIVRPLIRALRRWVEEGIEPPPSRYPKVEDGTLAPLTEALRRFPAIPRVATPTAFNELRLMDHRSIPPDEGALYPVMLPVVDEDGNAVAGIRHPLIAATWATFTGWNLRASGYAAGELAGTLGSMFVLARSKADRERCGDPRASIEERYGDWSGYVVALRAACEGLISEGYLLREDAERLLDAAKRDGNLLAVLN
ncbi:MAG: alpha/beta hydrolase domain-containing protein [Burkholderiales bacterium]